MRTRAFTTDDLRQRAMANRLRGAAGHLPGGVTVVTAIGSEGYAGMTASAVCSLSLEPPLVLACLERGSRTLQAIGEGGRFGINVLECRHEPIARAFATRGCDRGWGLGSWIEREGALMLEDCRGWISCELRDLLPGGDHEIAVGKVTEAHHSDDSGDPLVSYAGEYRSLRAGRPHPLERLAAEYGRAWNDHDLERIMSLHTSETSFRLWLHGFEEAGGRQDVRAQFELLLTAFPDIHFATEGLVLGDDLIVHRYQITATLAHPLTVAGIEAWPSGRPLRFAGADALTCRSGLVERKDTYLDALGLLLQLGLTPATAASGS
jgi:flavin reductase (DIM6/NTAB) family NADH-FMN oxidoreductase RutF